MKVVTVGRLEAQVRQIIAAIKETIEEDVEP